MFRQYREFEKGEFIVVGGDLAAGGGDRCAAQFVSKKNMDVPMVYHSSGLGTEMTNKLHPVLEEIFEITSYKPMVAYERQSGGIFEMERLAELNRSGKYDLFKMPKLGQVKKHKANRWGWDSNTATRPKMLADLKDAVDKQVLGIYDTETIEELFSFVVKDTSSSWKAEAEDNAHDDLVMSLAIAWQVYQFAEKPQDSTSLPMDALA